MDEYVILIMCLFLMVSFVTIIVSFRNRIIQNFETTEERIQELFQQKEENVEGLEENIVENETYLEQSTDKEFYTYTTETVVQSSVPKEKVSFSFSFGVVAVVITLAVLFFIYRMTKLVGNYILSWIMITKEDI